MKELSILKKVKQDLKSNKVEVMKVIENFFEKGEMSNNEWRKKKRELINLGKFIVAKGDDVNILEVREEPDFVVKWQNQKIGLEIVEVIDEAARQKAQKNEWLINQIHKTFKENYPNAHLFFSLSFEFDITNITKKEKKRLQQEIEFRHPEFPDKSKLYKLAHPGKYTKEELSVSPFAYFKHYKMIQNQADETANATDEIRFSAAVELQHKLLGKFYILDRSAV